MADGTGAVVLYVCMVRVGSQADKTCEYFTILCADQDCFGLVCKDNKGDTSIKLISTKIA